MTERTILGVKGTIKGQDPIKNQRWVSTRRPVDPEYWGADATMQTELRFDDSCKNGHASFGITAEIRRPRKRDVEACGCLHDEIETYFPELKPLIAHHLTSTDGPMHYIANTVYHAGNRDYNGLTEGEPFAYAFTLTFQGNPIQHRFPREHGFIEFLKSHYPDYDFEILQLDSDEPDTFRPKFTINPEHKLWYQGPFDTLDEAERFLFALQNCDPVFTLAATRWGEGKDRDLDAARRAANWPEATDEQLCLPKAELAELLEARLPALITEFKRTMTETCGFSL